MATNEYKVKLTADASGFSAGTRQAKKDLGDLSSQLGALRALSGRVLAFAGVGLVANEFIQIADAAGQTTARLRLATKATGDFAQVQRELIQGARDARAPLNDSVSLYAQIAPSLNAVGISSMRTAAAIKTVNQAIALSGSAGPSAAAALQQLSQGLAANELRGAELNSVLEQTPGLATALAEGLGVPVGALKEMASNGEITAEAFIKAMEKVAKRVDEDFRAMPTSVAQSITVFNDAVASVVSSFDQQSGLTAEIGASTIALGDGIKALEPVINGVLVPLTNIVINFIDVVRRMFRLLGTGIAGTIAMIQLAINGDLQGIKDTFAQMGEDTERILTEQLRSQKVLAAQEKQGADARVKLNEDLVRASQRLEDLRKVAAGEANADILKSDKELASARSELAEKSLKDQLKGQEALRDALRKSAEESLKSAQKSRESAEALRTQGRDARGSLQDRAAERRNRGLSDEDRSALAERQASTLSARATLTAGQAGVALREGDLKRAQKLSEEAVKLAERAEKAAGSILDDDTAARQLEELGRLQEKILNGQAAIKDAEAVEQENIAAQQFEQMAKIEERIKQLQAVLATPISISIDISEAEKKIAQLQAQLDQLNAVAGVQTPAPATPPTPPASFARGGWTGPGGKFQPAGIVHAGEVVVRSEVVRQPGMRALLEHINEKGAVALRGYAGGGFVQPRGIPRMPSIQPAQKQGGPYSTVVLDLGRGRRFEMRTEPKTARSVEEAIRIESLKVGL